MSKRKRSAERQPARKADAQGQRAGDLSMRSAKRQPARKAEATSALVQEPTSPVMAAGERPIMAGRRDQPIPTLSAFLICEQVIVDARTQKKTLVGLFTAAGVEQFPQGVKLGIFARLPDMDGDYDVRIEAVHAPTNAVIGTFAGQVNVKPDPLGVTELTLDVNLVVQSPGRHEFRCYCDDTFLGRTTMEVMPAEGMR